MSSEFLLPAFPILETERLLLRQETRNDVESVFEIFSNPSVTRFHDMDTVTHEWQVVNIIDRRTKRFEQGRGIRWGIVCKQDDRLVGSCGFLWNLQEHSADVGYELSSRVWRQGIMTEALQAILQFGFEEMALNYVTAEVMLDNIASRKLLEKVGFQSQGILRKQGFWKGRAHDLERFILNNHLS